MTPLLSHSVAQPHSLFAAAATIQGWRNNHGLWRHSHPDGGHPLRVDFERCNVADEGLWDAGGCGELLLIVHGFTASRQRAVSKEEPLTVSSPPSRF